MLEPPMVRYFLAVAQTGSIRAAAEILLIAPSAVSRQVHLLEREIGTRLFERTPTGMALNPAGDEVLAFFTEQRARAKELRGRLSPSDEPAVPVVRVGVLEGLVRLLPAAVRRIQRVSPATRIDAAMGGSDQIVDWILTRRVDVGFVSVRDHGPELSFVRTVQVPVHLVVGTDHSLATRSSVTLEEVNGLAVALPDTTFGIRRELDQACAEHGITLDLRSEANTLGLTLELARAGRLATFMTLAALPEDAAARGLQVVPIRDKRLRSVPISLVASAVHRTEATRLSAKALRGLLGDPLVRAWM
ncbi:LysR family transcriptional regulator [Kribbella catacumbae]|uniref:LysR family transcriptional regulator n=1 Tax=Kribbella catacumbae TaxID=460086 RepID=UPI00037FE36A|nr:LysR family transcriptional regulator [Kribbella catacumbae]